jgi:hypothetical protein
MNEKKKRVQREKKLLVQICDWLELHNVIYIHLETAITRFVNGAMKTFVINSINNCYVGVLDLIIFLPKCVLIIDTKYGYNKFTTDQKEWIDEMLKCQYVVSTDEVKSFEHFIEIYNKCLR